MPQLSPDSPVNVANYWVESVVKKSPYQDLAWDFVRFMTTPDNIARYTAAAKRPTPLRSQITEQVENPDVSPFAQQVLVAENWYRGRDDDEAIVTLQTMADQLLLPIPDSEDRIRYQINVIQNAARVIQQTM